MIRRSYIQRKPSRAKVALRNVATSKAKDRLRPKSKKRSALEAVALPWRARFVAEIGHCEKCGSTYRIHCHEITNGAARVLALMERAAILCVCWTCNTAFCDKGKYPVAWQVALLKLRRPHDYDLARINGLRGRALEAITQAEVDAFIPELKQLST